MADLMDVVKIGVDSTADTRNSNGVLLSAAADAPSILDTTPGTIEVCS